MTKPSSANKPSVPQKGAVVPPSERSRDSGADTDNYDSDAAYLARQRHQRNEEGDIHDPRGG